MQSQRVRKPAGGLGMYLVFMMALAVSSGRLVNHCCADLVCSGFGTSTCTPSTHKAQQSFDPLDVMFMAFAMLVSAHRRALSAKRMCPGSSNPRASCVVCLQGTNRGCRKEWPVV